MPNISEAYAAHLVLEMFDAYDRETRPPRARLVVTAALKLALLDGPFPGAPTKGHEPLSVAVSRHSG